MAVAQLSQNTQLFELVQVYLEGGLEIAGCCAMTLGKDFWDTELRESVKLH